MKALRYLLIVAMISMASVLSAANAAAQNLATRPEMQMQSTSVMKGSGSALPQAAVDGPYTTGTTIGTYSPAGSSSRPRRVGENDGWEDEDEPEKPGEPSPIGDAAWPLALLALAYLITRVTRKRRV
ncbi:MAG: hypothetical protein IJ204_00520 [Paludibacteraceae bacterium]|nr:hypothetical protein [Paludibacteraceae bacterium]